jgi:hypothetical protein
VASRDLRALYSAFEALARRGHGPALRWCLEHFENARPPLAGSAWAPEERAAWLALARLLVHDHPGLCDDDWFANVERVAARAGHEDVRALLEDAAARCADPARAMLAAARVLDDGTQQPGPRRARAQALVARILRDHPRAPAAADARALGWRLAHLAPGVVAPDFVTRDHAGNEIRSSDYRGQVLVVRLWGADLGRARPRLREELELARRLWDERFALVGVARGVRREALREHLEDEGVHWGVALEPPGAPGVGRAWRVDAPTTIVLDPQGVVRGVGVAGPELTRLVDELLADLRAATEARERALDTAPDTGGGS